MGGDGGFDAVIYTHLQHYVGDMDVAVFSEMNKGPNSIIRCPARSADRKDRSTVSFPLFFGPSACGNS